MAAMRMTRIIATAIGAVLQNQIRDLSTLILCPAFGHTVLENTITDRLAMLDTIRRISLTPLHASFIELRRPLDALFLRETGGNAGIQHPAGPHVTALFAGRRFTCVETFRHEHSHLFKTHRFLFAGCQALL
jgi:hypothetical protein